MEELDLNIQFEAQHKIHPFGVRLEFLLQEETESKREEHVDNAGPLDHVGEGI
jgi:hypothetical protein